MGLWDRYAVPALISRACATRPIMKQREKVVPSASGRVLELGCGSGTNFGYYDLAKVEALYALEPAPGMLARAQKTLESDPRGGQALKARTTLLDAGAEAIPLDDNSIDTAVITFVLCTIPDWEASLAEVRRVLKPGGRIVFSEHGLAPDEGVARWQRRVEPVWKPLAGGCHLTRDTGALLTQAGFRLEGVETMYLPNTPKIAGFVSWGGAAPA